MNLSSLSLREVLSQEWQAVVVGAGPAGSVAALGLARRGIRVLLVDKATFPRWKVCGCCLNGSALTLLGRLGLDLFLTQMHAIPLTQVCLSSAKRSVRLSMPSGVSISRQLLDTALINQAIQAGSFFLPRTQASLGDVTSKGRRVHFQSDGHLGTVDAKIVLAADGLNGQLAASSERFEISIENRARIGAGTIISDVPQFFESGTIYMATGSGGYVGLVRLEDDTLDIGAAFDSQFVRHSSNLANAAKRILSQTNWPEIPNLEKAIWKGTPPLTRKPNRVAGEKWFAIGDSCGYVEPFTGEGMAWAISSAVHVVPLVVEALKNWTPELASRWHQIHEQVIGSRQGICRWTSRILRYPWLCNLAIRGLKLFPQLSVPILRRLNHPPARIREQNT